jgi:hypothetical protein
MSTTPASNSRRDGIAAAIGILVLILGTATGNAYAMLAMALVAFAVIAIFYRHDLGRRELLLMTLAAATSSVVVFAISRL